MKLEDQVVSLELAKEMKELGVPQNSIFGWYQYKGYDPYIEYNALEQRESCERSFVDGYSEDPTLLCSAPTVAELGEMLPPLFSSYKTEYDGWQCESPWGFCNLSPLPTSKGGITIWGTVTPARQRRYREEGGTEADTRAKMLIYLIKEGYIKVEEIGK